MNKASLRGEMRRKLRGMSGAEREEASSAIHQALEASSEVSGAGCVLLFAGTALEPDLLPWCEKVWQKGEQRLLFPKVLPGSSLSLHEVTSEEQLVVGAFGIREPVTTLCNEVSFDQVDVVLVPGLAFARLEDGGESGRNFGRFGRLGQGGGYYDRLLPELRGDCVRVGVCFGRQVVESLPVQEHDEGVEFLVNSK